MANILVEILKLVRFEHAIMLAFAVLIAETVVLGSFPALSTVLLLSLLVPVLSEMGAFALNDYLDVESDRLNKKTDRPLVSGTISPKFALWIAIICTILSIVFAYPINMSVFVIAIIFALLSIAYNARLKDLPLVGNIYIGLSMAIPFIFGNYVVSPVLSPLALSLAFLAFLAGVAREIIKSAQDMAGDKEARKSTTLPLVIGEKPAVNLAIFLYFVFVASCFLPSYFGLKFSFTSSLFVIIGALSIIYVCYRLFISLDYRSARKLSLLAFGLGMSGFFLAALGF